MPGTPMEFIKSVTYAPAASQQKGAVPRREPRAIGSRRVFHAVPHDWHHLNKSRKRKCGQQKPETPLYLASIVRGVPREKARREPVVSAPPTPRRCPPAALPPPRRRPADAPLRPKAPQAPQRKRQRNSTNSSSPTYPTPPEAPTRS